MPIARKRRDAHVSEHRVGGVLRIHAHLAGLDETPHRIEPRPHRLSRELVEGLESGAFGIEYADTDFRDHPILHPCLEILLGKLDAFIHRSERRQVRIENSLHVRGIEHQIPVDEKETVVP